MNEDFNFEIKVRDAITPQGKKIAIVGIKGRLDSLVTLEARRQLHQIVDFGYTDLLLDMTYVERLDSSGLGVLISTLRKCKAMRGNLCVYNLSEEVALTFSAAAMDKILANYNDESTAIAYFPAFMS